MFSLAYVILPFSDRSPAEAIAASLDRFRRGGKDDVPDEWLRFSDETADIQRLHQTRFEFVIGEGLEIHGGDGDHWDLNVRAIRGAMASRGLDRWIVRFADLEPDLERFAAGFVRSMDRHPVTSGFGHWHNDAGRWDWWEVGGRFSGLITGLPRRAGRGRTAVSSGPSEGRDLLDKLVDTLASTLDQPSAEAIDLREDENVELVSALLQDGVARERARRPGAVVLPPGSIADACRWCGSWPNVGPPETVRLLTGAENAEWPAVVEAALRRFPDHWAAGVAFHH